MKVLKFSLLCAAAALGFNTGAANANEWRAVPYYVGYTEKSNTGKQERELVHYQQYEDREPCQKYQPPPEGFYRDGCHLFYKQAVATPPPPPAVDIVRRVQTSYTILFGFDKDNIEPQAQEIINKISSDILTYKPYEVTVAGHTDTVGTSQYNMGLSKRRADSVSRALTSKGVPNRVIDEKAYGETHLAVQTGKGVRNRENRRVVVNFMK
jgi:outer membrane protein OmpA-like peptidoglycan-associated protein